MYKIHRNHKGQACSVILSHDDGGSTSIPFDGLNRHFREFWEWQKAQSAEKKLDLTGIEIENGHALPA